MKIGDRVITVKDTSFFLNPNKKIMIPKGEKGIVEYIDYTDKYPIGVYLNQKFGKSVSCFKENELKIIEKEN